MTEGQPPLARMPASAPSKADLAERDRYAKLAAASMDTVRASARTWRTGLAAFITLVTTGVVIKGRDTTSGLASSWRSLVTVLVGGGLLLAVVGLWQALAAEAGTDPQKRTLQDIRADYGTLTAYQVHLADVAARRLQWGQRSVAAAIVFLLAGIGATWWAPEAVPARPAYIRVAHGHAVACGILRSADARQLHLAVRGSRKPIDIPFSEIVSLVVVSSCS